ncbi:hypothetical protein WICPIJ_003028 [Wickerhamomyces pijperi]|uniref:Uncharacterized protein n=1 Tax=Wickerhamomyces pijperi TaxID=599730 RepID=A0A9P8TNE5_WICPI|nr:hypothetical protein WICPIJ_003028 [Wickerhamomyces pijperi]
MMLHKGNFFNYYKALDVFSNDTNQLMTPKSADLHHHPQLVIQEQPHTQAFPTVSIAASVKTPPALLNSLVRDFQQNNTNTSQQKTESWLLSCILGS